MYVCIYLYLGGQQYIHHQYNEKFIFSNRVVAINKNVSSMTPNHSGCPSLLLKFTVDMFTSVYVLNSSGYNTTLHFLCLRPF